MKRPLACQLMQLAAPSPNSCLTELLLRLRARKRQAEVSLLLGPQGEGKAEASDSRRAGSSSYLKRFVSNPKQSALPFGARAERPTLARPCFEAAASSKVGSVFMATCVTMWFGPCLDLSPHLLSTIYSAISDKFIGGAGRSICTAKQVSWITKRKYLSCY